LGALYQAAVAVYIGRVALYSLLIAFYLVAGAANGTTVAGNRCSVAINAVTVASDLLPIPPAYYLAAKPVYRAAGFCSFLLKIYQSVTFVYIMKIPTSPCKPFLLRVEPGISVPG
jgi:hypothetical protein